MAEGDEHSVKEAEFCIVRESVCPSVAEMADPAPLERVRRENVQPSIVALPHSFSPPLILTAGEERETGLASSEEARSTEESFRRPL